MAGFAVIVGMLGSQRMPGVTALFLATTILTSVTGFLFPISGFTPALEVGIISLIILAIALLALYGRHLAGAWRWIYVVSAVAALCLRADCAGFRETLGPQPARAAGRPAVS